MRVIAFDTETELIRPGLQAPPLVCVTWQELGLEPQIKHVSEAADLVLEWLLNDQLLLVGHNVAYDMAVICAQWPEFTKRVFEKYNKNLVVDTMHRQQLLDIASNCYRGRPGDDGKWVTYNYSLDDCIHRYRGSRLKKDGWRLVYGYFRETPIHGWFDKALEVKQIASGWLATAFTDSDKKVRGNWPEPLEFKDVKALVEEEPQGVLEYPLEDARATLEVYQGQEKHREYLDDQFRKAQNYFALHLSECWGIRTTTAGVDELERLTTIQYEEAKQELVAAGIVRANGTRNIKAAQQAMIDACDRLGLDLRLTEGGAPSLDRDACSFVDDPTIKAYSKFLTCGKVLSNDVANLRRGINLPIHPRYGLADTGRTTCTGYNIQAIRRLPGIREVFSPRPGYVFMQADYEGLELHTFAQVCVDLFGHSEMAKALAAGLDPHLIVASRILGVPYDDAKRRLKEGDKEVKEARQVSKPCNFGFIDGLSPVSYVDYARKVYGVKLSDDLDEALDKAQMLKREWLKQWPEADEYFDYVRGKMTEENGKIGKIIHPRVNRQRYGTFTGLCSALHQGMGADCATHAMWLVAKAQYTDRKSPLFGTRTVAFVHDEIIGEVREEYAHEAATELGRLMRQGADEFLPDAPTRLEPLLMNCWSKNAKPLYDDRGRLQVWRLEEHDIK